MKVVLPDPEGPMMAVIVPAGISKLIPFKIALFSIFFFSLLYLPLVQIVKFSILREKPSKRSVLKYRSVVFTVNAP